MKLLIVGATLEGYILAYWLQQNGINSVIVDEAERFEPVSYPYGLRVKTISVLKKMDILEADTQENLRLLQEDLPNTLLLNEAGQVISSLDIPKYSQPPLRLAINHAYLHTAMHEGMKDRVEIQYGRKIKAMTQCADSVEICFADGCVEAFDLVVGADGVTSKIRQVIFGDTVAHSSDMSLMAFMVDRTCADIGDQMSYHITTPEITAFVGYYQCGIGGVFFFKKPSQCTISADARKSFLLNLCQSNFYILESVINQLPDTAPIFYQDVWKIDLPHWSHGRVTLLGDAVHYPLVRTDQGSRMAICGAYTLANSLTDCEHYMDAFANYEMTMRKDAW